MTSPGWYAQRGVKFSVQFGDRPTDPNFEEKFNRASNWTNESFIIRLIVAFEALAHGPKPNECRLPNNPGMREFHHARGLRNAISHGDDLTAAKLVNEETILFRSGAAGASCCSITIDEVLEPLWARLLIYARSLEQGGTPAPANPSVVVACNDNVLTVQTMNGIKALTLNENDARLNCKIGEIISL